MSQSPQPHAPKAAQDANRRITAIVREHGDRLRAFLSRRVFGRDVVEEILQEVLLELVESFRFGQEIEQVGSWLMTVARHRMIDRFRKTATRRQWESPGRKPTDEPQEAMNLLSSNSDEPAQRLANELLLDELEAALAELPPEQSLVFIAHELRGQSFQELSDELGVPLNTLLARKHRAVKFLRLRLADIRTELLEQWK